MSRPFFSPSSRRDLLDILENTAKDKRGAAVRHVERLEEACWALAKNPGMGAAHDDLLPNLRGWSFGNHLIFFRPTQDGIDVVRLVHGARDIGNCSNDVQASLHQRVAGHQVIDPNGVALGRPHRPSFAIVAKARIMHCDPRRLTDRRINQHAASADRMN